VFCNQQALSLHKPESSSLKNESGNKLVPGIPKRLQGSRRGFFLHQYVIRIESRDRKNRYSCLGQRSRKEARTPVSENGNGPSSLKQSHCDSHFAFSGTRSAAHTIESSSSVRVIERKDAGLDNAGISAFEGKRQTAKEPASFRNFSCISKLLRARSREPPRIVWGRVSDPSRPSKARLGS
jgi:hypothetical protein